jgi:hypothetical protein
VLFGGGGSVVEDEPGDLFVVPVGSLTLSVEFTLKAHYYIGLFHYHQDYRLKLSLPNFGYCYRFKVTNIRVFSAYRMSVNNNLFKICQKNHSIPSLG